MKLLRGLWLLALLMPVFASHAAVTVTITESGADVVAQASGSLMMPTCSTGDLSVPNGFMNWLANDNFAYIVGNGPGELCSITFTTSEALHNAFIDEFADSSSGGPVGVNFSGGGSSQLVVPANFTGGPINATSTWQNQTLATLQLTPGIYVFDFGTDTITFNVGAVSPPAAAQAVPANSWFALLLAALGAMVVGARRFRS